MAVARFKPRLWHLALVALIGVFELGVLWLVLHPRVAQDYYDYYISREASCFPRIVSGYYPWGKPVSFVTGRNGYQRDSIRWCGFQAPNATGIRSFGDYGRLKLANPPKDRDFVLSFSSWANTDQSKPKRDVRVSVNGEDVGILTFTTAKRLNGRLIVPAWVAALKPEAMEIQFTVPRTGPAGTNGEPQTLQLRLESFLAQPLPVGDATTNTGAAQKTEAGTSPASSRSVRTGLTPAR